MSYFNMCPICQYALTAIVEDDKLLRNCRECGYSEEDAGGLIHETFINEKVSKSHEILINEFTRQEPTLPYKKDLKCPNSKCDSNTKGLEKKVYYLKTDYNDMKFAYLCANCDQTWTSRPR